MAVYVDDVRHRYGRMIMCHCWADTLPELFAMMDKIGVNKKWLQQPPKASWVHFDICLDKKALAIAAGAILTDKYGPVEHVAKRNGDGTMLRLVKERREAGKTINPVITKKTRKPKKPFTGKLIGKPNHGVNPGSK